MYNITVKNYSADNNDYRGNEHSNEWYWKSILVIAFEKGMNEIEWDLFNLVKIPLLSGEGLSWN